MIQETVIERPTATATAQLSVAQFSYFPTLIFRFDVPGADALNERLLPLIYAARDADRHGVQKSNYRVLGGWHSKENLHKNADFAELVRHVDAAGRVMSKELRYHEDHRLRIGTMWSIVNGPGASNLAHVHPGCLWSGVYYVRAPANCGKISFTDPRTAHVMRKPVYSPGKGAPRKCWTKVSFAPVAGRMLIFPSWLYHAVDPNLADASKGDADRVIISFNISQVRK